MRSKTWLIIGYLLIAVAFCFLIFAMMHPVMAFSWPVTVTRVVYLLYMVATIFSFVMFCVSKDDKKDE